jgi:hypothetical protein
MARKVTGGLTGSPSVGALNVAPTAVVTAADNQDITLSPSGTGMLMLTANAQLQAQSDLRFADADSSNWVAFQAPATVAANVTWTLPATDGTSDQVLTTNASGTLSWSSKSVVISDQLISASTFYPLFTTNTSGAASTVSVATSKMTFQPSTGTLTVTAITESSSRALKMNINPIDNALDAILKLKGVTYDRKDGSTQNEAGLIAEQVNKILPNIVSKDAKGKPTGIHYTKLTAYLIEAVKSLQLEINDLTKQLKKTQKGEK